MAIKISELEGIDPQFAEVLMDAGLNNSNRLLSVAASPEGRRALASELGISETELIDLVNRADLARIDGIGKIYSDLLELAGVDTVIELRTRNPRNLHAKIKEVAQKHHVRRTPNPATVEDWIEQAQGLARTVTY